MAGEDKLSVKKQKTEKKLPNETGSQKSSSTKKQVPLRLSEKLYNQIAAWAEDDFRSINGQIEYLLTECVKQRKKDGKYVSEHLDEPIELDIR